MKGLAFLIKFSYRNLLRVPKRTFIMIMSLALGTGFIIWDLNFANSGSKEVMKEFLSQYAGLYHVTNKDYYDKENKKLFNNYKTLRDEDIEDKRIIPLSTKRITAPVFISGEKKTLGVLLTGVEVEKEQTLSQISKAIREGRFPNPGNLKEIVIGRKLAQRINVNLNDEVAVIGQAMDGSVANDLMKVVGILDFGGGDLEESLAFTQFESAEEFVAMPEGNYHQRVSFDMNAAHLPKLSNLAVTSWEDLLPEISISIRFIDRFTWTVSLVIVIVLSLGLSNTLMITFFEREQEFQSLNIIGAKASWVTLSLVIEVFIMGSIAILIGVLIGHLATTLNGIYPVNIQAFTGGKPIIMGGMTIIPLVKLYPVNQYYWQVPLMIYCFLSATMIYPLIRVVRRSKHAV